MTKKQRMLARVVAREFEVPDSFIDIKGRSKRVVTPKQVLSYFLYHKAELTLNDVAKALGYKEHSTIIHSLKTVEGLYAEDYYRVRIDRISDAANKIFILNETV
jgi:chromosomal replication initiator protein